MINNSRNKGQINSTKPCRLVVLVNTCISHQGIQQRNPFYGINESLLFSIVQCSVFCLHTRYYQANDLLPLTLHHRNLKTQL